MSQDGTIGVLRIPLTELPGAIPHETGTKLIDLAEAQSNDGVRVELGGQLIANAQEGEISSEMIGMAIAALVLLLTFGSIVAAGLPIATALFGLGISSALTGLLAAVMDVPDWAPALASMLGIGVGIDYALLIITRYRAALGAGLAPREAVAESVTTAGRSVLIAGMTVVISLLGLLLMGLPYLYGAAVATIVAVLVVMAASVTLVPALMSVAGTRIDRLRIPGVNRSAADPTRMPAARWGRAVQRRPLVAAIAGVAVLLVLASPFAGLRLGFPDRGNDAADTTTRQAYELVSQGFGPGANGPLLLAADHGGRPGSATRWARSPRSCARSRASPSVSDPVDEPGRRRDDADRDADDVAAGRGDRGPHPPPARRRAPRRRRGREGRRRDRRVHGPEPGDRRPAAAVHRRRARPVVPAAAVQLPLGRDRREGRGDDAALDRRRVRHGRVPGRGRLGRPADRDRHRDAGAAVHPGDHVRGPLRTLDGLRGVPALAGPGGVPGRHATRRAR